MTKDFKEFLELLNYHKVKYVIVGAHAVTAHSRPRSTGDLDVLIEASEENAKNIVAALIDFGFGSLELKTEDFCKTGFVIQLGYEPNRIDILTSVTGVDWEEIWENKISNVFGSSDIPVFFIGKEQLIKNKIATGRELDIKDAERLMKFKPKGGEIT